MGPLNQNEKQPVHPENGPNPTGDPLDSHAAVPALANLFLALFIWVAGTGLSGFLAQTLAEKGWFTPDGAGKIQALSAASLLVFPAQLLVLVWMLRHPQTACPPAVFGGMRPKGWLVLLAGGGAILASHGLWFGLGFVFTCFFGQNPESHPLNQLLSQGGKTGLILVALQGCMVAPVLEEILCRGYLQSLLGRLGFRTTVGIGMLVALMLLGFGLSPEKFQGAFGKFNGFLIGLLLIIPWLVLSWAGHSLGEGRLAWAAVVAQAQIFSGLHASSWPAPVALLPLAIGLGWVRAQGQNLALCVLVHSAFNLVSLILAWCALSA